VLITQLDGLKTSIKDMVGKIDLDLPFLSVSLGGVADLLDVVDDNLLSRIGYRMGGVGNLLPDFGLSFGLPGMTTFLVIEDMWPSLYQVNTRFQSSFPVLLDRSFSGRRCQHNLHRFLGMTVLDGWYKN